MKPESNVQYIKFSRWISWYHHGIITSNTYAAKKYRLTLSPQAAWCGPGAGSGGTYTLNSPTANTARVSCSGPGKGNKRRIQ